VRDDGPGPCPGPPVRALLLDLLAASLPAWLFLAYLGYAAWSLWWI
jgi:hypothetical protein